MLGIGKRSPEFLTSEALAKGVALGFIPVIVPHIELWIVGEDRAYPYKDRIVPGTEERVRPAVLIETCDLERRAIGVGNPAVSRLRTMDRDPRAPLRHEGDESTIEAPAFFRQDRADHLDTGIPKCGNPLPCYHWIRVNHAEHQLLHSTINDVLDALRSFLLLVATRFQIYIQRVF